MSLQDLLSSHQDFTQELRRADAVMQDILKKSFPREPNMDLIQRHLEHQRDNAFSVLESKDCVALDLGSVFMQSASWDDLENVAVCSERVKTITAVAYLTATENRVSQLESRETLQQQTLRQPGVPLSWPKGGMQRLQTPSQTQAQDFGLISLKRDVIKQLTEDSTPEDDPIQWRGLISQIATLLANENQYRPRHMRRSKEEAMEAVVVVLPCHFPEYVLDIIEDIINDIYHTKNDVRVQFVSDVAAMAMWYARRSKLLVPPPSVSETTTLESTIPSVLHKAIVQEQKWACLCIGAGFTSAGIVQPRRVTHLLTSNRGEEDADADEVSAARQLDFDVTNSSHITVGAQELVQYVFDEFFRQVTTGNDLPFEQSKYRTHAVFWEYCHKRVVEGLSSQEFTVDNDYIIPWFNYAIEPVVPATNEELKILTALFGTYPLKELAKQDKSGLHVGKLRSFALREVCERSIRPLWDKLLDYDGISVPNKILVTGGMTEFPIVQKWIRTLDSTRDLTDSGKTTLHFLSSILPVADSDDPTDCNSSPLNILVNGAATLTSTVMSRQCFVSEDW